MSMTHVNTHPHPPSPPPLFPSAVAFLLPHLALLPLPRSPAPPPPSQSPVPPLPRQPCVHTSAAVATAGLAVSAGWGEADSLERMEEKWEGQIIEV